jgi:hypothetical protein
VEQIQLAMHGYLKPVKVLKTATWTKDMIEQHWIKILV